MITRLINGRIVMPTEVVDNHDLYLADEDILMLRPDRERAQHPCDRELDMEGAYLTPGFIDIHSDYIEQMIQPRPTTMMDFPLAIRETEKVLLGQGITTMFHSLSLYAPAATLRRNLVRSSDNALKLGKLIRETHAKEHLIHHRFHARYEVDNIEILEPLKAWIADGMVHEVSIMDHTPGQGQYHDLVVYRKTMNANRGSAMSEADWCELMQRHEHKQKVSYEQLAELVAVAKRHGIAIASHDDDTVAKVELIGELGCEISEFPITMAAAHRARELGLYTVAGAPNILLGGSHTGNISAAEAIMDGAIDILCSDYYPPAMLHAVFAMVNDYRLPLHEAVALVTINPARAVKIDSLYGSLEPGKKADLLAVRDMDGIPAICRVFIHGQCVSHLDYRMETAESIPASKGA